MARVLILFAHPALEHSRVHRRLLAEIRDSPDVTLHDLYEAYPRLDIDVEREQRRLQDHDVILFQFPVFWYSTPSLVKEWEDLVLEHGFAYGVGGDRLAGKRLMLAITGAGPEDAYTERGYQRFPLRTFLTPLEQTARLCGMRFPAPYVLYGALRAPDEGRDEPHVLGYRRLLEAIRDDRYDFETAERRDVIQAHDLPIHEGT